MKPSCPTIGCLQVPFDLLNQLEMTVSCRQLPASPTGYNRPGRLAQLVGTLSNVGIHSPQSPRASCSLRGVCVDLYQHLATMSATATATTSALEPFPLFIDSAPHDAANYFSNISSKMSSLQMLSSSPTPPASRRRVSVTAKLSNLLRLRYYQYEVTFGLYMLTPGEKMLLNTIILSIFAALLYAFSWGVQPFLVNTICKILYYVLGSAARAGELCAVRTGEACAQ